MANPMRGQARFEADDKSYTLTFSFNELVTLEEELEVKVEEMGAKIGEGARTLRTVFRICLEAEHGQMTDREVGDIISSLGPEAAAELLGRAFSAAFPTGAPDPRKPAGAPAKPKARGTGIAA